LDAGKVFWAGQILRWYRAMDMELVDSCIKEIIKEIKRG
jgi:hypothetical protein